jgi:hypothetical protein
MSTSTSRDDHRPRAARLAATIAVTAVLLGGCVSSNFHSGTTDPGSIVHDNALTIDFTRRPTRADLGLAADRSFRAYDRTGPMLQATLKFPGGTVRVPATSVLAATDSSGGATDVNYTHQPKYFTVSRTFTGVGEARTALTQDAAVLGLSRTEIEENLPDLGGGTIVPQTRVLHGLVHDWLSVEVDLTDGDEPGVIKADYQIAVDAYHNPALDKVVRDGVFTADLTRKPTRADLGMLDGYGESDARPAWGERLAVAWTLPTGVLAEPVASVLTYSGAGASVDAFGKAEPDRSIVLLATKDFADGAAQLTRDAPLLGLDPATVRDVFAGAPAGTRVSRTVNGADTPHYGVTAKIEVGRSATTPGTATIHYTFHYK